MVFYRLVMGVLAPALIALTLVQRLRGRLGHAAVRERLGFIAGPEERHANPPTIWLHAASNGEVTSARGTLQGLLAARPGLRVLVTVNTGTAVTLVRDWGLPGVQVALAPIDSFGSSRRVLRRWRPMALIVVENELWPGRLADCHAEGVPTILIGARMSQKSAAMWAKMAPGLMRSMLGQFAMVSAQDAGSSARLRGLGLPQQRLAPEVMLKAGMAPSGAAAAVSDIAQVVERARVLLAASTHPGEEALILQAFAAARGQFDLLILAPRHPRRSAEVAGVIAAAGFSFVRRSDGARPVAGVPVFLADTMGEMGLWYAMAGVTVIGGSFVPLGGHTPFEPAVAGSAIVHGPHMENFAEPAAALAAVGGALAVSRSGLGAALANLHADRQARLVTAARAALPTGDGVHALVSRILALLPATP